MRIDPRVGLAHPLHRGDDLRVEEVVAQRGVVGRHAPGVRQQAGRQALRRAARTASIIAAVGVRRPRRAGRSDRRRGRPSRAPKAASNSASGSAPVSSRTSRSPRLGVGAEQLLDVVGVEPLGAAERLEGREDVRGQHPAEVDQQSAHRPICTGPPPRADRWGALHGSTRPVRVWVAIRFGRWPGSSGCCGTARPCRTTRERDDADRELTPKGERPVARRRPGPRAPRRRVRRVLREPEGPGARHRAARRAPSSASRSPRTPRSPAASTRADAETLVERARRATCWSSATSRTSRRSSTTSRARGWTSRRAASRRSGSDRPPRARRAAAPGRAASLWPAERRASPRRARPRRARCRRALEHELAGVVRGAAARAEPVDRDGDVRREVAGVGRAAAGVAVQRAAERRRRGARAPARRPRARPSRARRAAARTRGGRRRARRARRRARRRRPRGRPRAGRSRARPSPGTTLKASPALQDRRHGGEAVLALRVVAARRRRWATWASASSALRPASGAEPECAARPCARTCRVPAPLRLTTTASSPSVGRLARPRSTGRRPSRRTPRRGRRARSATPRRRRAAARPRRRASGRGGERAQDAEREDDAALHVHRARAVEPAVARVAQRLVVGVGDDRVDVAEQQDRARCRCRATRARRSGAWPGEEHSGRSIAALVGQQRRAQRGALLRARRRRRTATRRPRAPRARAGARAAMRAACSATQGSIQSERMPELPEVEVTARLLDAAVAGARGRVGAHAGRQRAQDVRPAAARARRQPRSPASRRRGKLLLVALRQRR